jgi:hypothetical protein
MKKQIHYSLRQTIYVCMYVHVYILDNLHIYRENIYIYSR